MRHGRHIRRRRLLPTCSPLTALALQRARGYGRDAVEFRILGPLEVRTDNGAVTLGGPKPRAVLAVLLLHANRAVSGEQLALALWGEEAPAGATKTVQVHVSRLRKALGDSDALVTTAGGYELRVEPGELDAHRFEQRLADGRAELAAGRASEAATILEDALALWRGRPLEDLSYEPFAQRECARLEDLRVAAYEQLVGAKLALGRHAEVVGQLETLIDATPTASACARSSCSPSIAATARPTRCRSTRTPATNSSTSWGSSRVTGCASSSGRSSRRTPRWP